VDTTKLSGASAVVPFTETEELWLMENLIFPYPPVMSSLFMQLAKKGSAAASNTNILI
jgi:hypothetical protein